jgi:hypothetical protein
MSRLPSLALLLLVFGPAPGATAETIALFAECVGTHPTDAAKQIVRFGYQNSFPNNGAALDTPYGVSNLVTLDGQDAGPAAGVPSRLKLGLHTSAFIVAFAQGQTVRWRVRDPQTGTLVTAGPSSSTPPCDLTIGPAGPTGQAGAAGLAGPDGSQGETGETGAVGATGPPGAAGAQGPKGDAGAPGAPGPAGTPGAQGPTGPNGETGATGSQGSQGIRGATGAEGAIGSQGAAGPQGAAGAQGAIGPPGPTGGQGPPGPQGESFAKATLLFLPAGSPAPVSYAFVGRFTIPGDGDKMKGSLPVDVYRRN